MPRPPGELNATRADAICQSSYVHRTNGRAAAAMLMCGRPGPIAVHTPDVCYPGAGYRQVGPRKIIDVPAPAEPNSPFCGSRKMGPPPSRSMFTSPGTMAMAGGCRTTPYRLRRKARIVQTLRDVRM